MHNTHKYLFFLLLLTSIIMAGCGNEEPKANKPVTIRPAGNPSAEALIAAGLDKSPMDMAYYPVDYPKLKMSKSNSEPLVARVIYSRPQKGGRTIFGEVLKYGSIWRLGANEATEIEFFRDVTIDKQSIPKGRYVLYGIPFEDKWTLVLNNDLFAWGLKIDTTKDAYHFSIPVSRTRFPFEVFTMEFQKAENGLELVMEWDSIRAILPIKYR